MADSMTPPSRAGDWHVDWSCRRTRLRVTLLAVSVSLATVVGSIAGLFPEALLFAFLTGRGIADADGWAVTLAGDFVQLVSVLLALFVLARIIRWATPDRSEIDDLDILGMDESLRRMGREKFVFLLIVAIAIPTQVIVWLAEDVVVARIGWVDGAFLELSRFPQAAFLIIASGGLIKVLRRFLATKE